MEKQNKSFKLSFPIILISFLIIVYSVFVRAQGIGYSGFQGDEVNPMTFLYDMKSGPIAYLIEQKRAPMQYIINLINVSMFGYHNEETLIRLIIYCIGALFCSIKYELLCSILLTLLMF